MSSRTLTRSGGATLHDVGLLLLVDGERRRRLAREALDGYASGPDAPIEATATALTKAESARSVVLVEGISDQIALETLASRRGQDLGAEGIVIVPIGGAQAVTRYLVRFGPEGARRLGARHRHLVGHGHDLREQGAQVLVGRHRQHEPGARARQHGEGLP